MGTNGVFILSARNVIQRVLKELTAVPHAALNLIRLRISDDQMEKKPRWKLNKKNGVISCPICKIGKSYEECLGVYPKKCLCGVKLDLPEEVLCKK